MGSDALVNFATLPMSLMQWDAYALVHGVLFIVWWLGLTSLSAGSGEGWVNWNVGHVLGGMSAKADIGVGKYTGDGTINLSVLGGGSNSASKADHYANLPIRFSRDGNVGQTKTAG